MSQACTMLTLNFAVNKYMPKIYVVFTGKEAFVMATSNIKLGRAM